VGPYAIVWFLYPFRNTNPPRAASDEPTRAIPPIALSGITRKDPTSRWCVTPLPVRDPGDSKHAYMPKLDCGDVSAGITIVSETEPKGFGISCTLS